MIVYTPRSLYVLQLHQQILKPLFKSTRNITAALHLLLDPQPSTLHLNFALCLPRPAQYDD
jgi:hypothetical protein